MRWEDTAPRPGINLGAALGIPDDPALFRVSILRVPDGDPLPVAFTEFWRRVLTDGPPLCAPGWAVLAVESWPDSGGFTAVFTQADLCGDQPPVFKLRSAEMERRWYDLPDPDADPAGFDAAACGLEQEWVDLLIRAARADAVAGLLAGLRLTHSAPVWLTNQTRSRHRVLNV